MRIRRMRWWRRTRGSIVVEGIGIRYHILSHKKTSVDQNHGRVSWRSSCGTGPEAHHQSHAVEKHDTQAASVIYAEVQAMALVHS